jgi:multidrug efflux system membrane fusion protein
VFVVNGNNAVEAMIVNISREIGGEVVIAEGVKVNEIVVTDGQMQLVPGSKVKIKNAEVLKGE